MVYPVCQFSAFQKALNYQGWDLTLPFTPSENTDPYEYELDDREIVWVLFVNEEDYTAKTLCADVGKGLWYEYLEAAQSLYKSGILVQAYWIQPDGTIVNYNVNSLLSFPFGIPLYT